MEDSFVRSNDAMNYYSYKIYKLPDIPESLKDEICRFVCSLCPAVEVGYIEERFLMYPEMIIMEKDGGLCAVQFLNKFSFNEKAYCYMDPLYSKGGAFFPLFIHFMNDMINAFPGYPIILSTEFENPALFLHFKTLFSTRSYPCLVQKATPVFVRNELAVFEKEIGHIKDLNPFNMSSSGKLSHCSGTKRPEVVIKWMENRSVKIRSGGNQVFIAFIENHEKKKVLSELTTFS